MTLADVRAPALEIVCERCGRYGYSVPPGNGPHINQFKDL